MSIKSPCSYCADKNNCDKDNCQLFAFYKKCMEHEEKKFHVVMKKIKELEAGG